MNKVKHFATNSNSEQISISSQINHFLIGNHRKVWLGSRAFLVKKFFLEGIKNVTQGPTCISIHIINHQNLQNQIIPPTESHFLNCADASSSIFNRQCESHPGQESSRRRTWRSQNPIREQWQAPTSSLDTALKIKHNKRSIEISRLTKCRIIQTSRTNNLNTHFSFLERKWQRACSFSQVKMINRCFFNSWISENGRQNHHGSHFSQFSPPDFKRLEVSPELSPNMYPKM